MARGDDWDTDLLANDVELKYALDPCKADTDGDKIGDGWEFCSGKDLNARAVPYPGKRRYREPAGRRRCRVSTSTATA